MRTETEAAQTLLHERASQLTTALQQHGIVVEQFEVSADWSEQDTDSLFDDPGSDVLADHGRNERRAPA